MIIEDLELYEEDDDDDVTLNHIQIVDFIKNVAWYHKFMSGLSTYEDGKILNLGRLILDSETGPYSYAYRVSVGDDVIFADGMDFSLILLRKGFQLSVDERVLLELIRHVYTFEDFTPECVKLCYENLQKVLGLNNIFIEEWEEME